MGVCPYLQGIFMCCKIYVFMLYCMIYGIKSTIFGNVKGDEYYEQNHRSDRDCYYFCGNQGFDRGLKQYEMCDTLRKVAIIMDSTTDLILKIIAAAAGAAALAICSTLEEKGEVLQLCHFTDSDT